MRTQTYQFFNLKKLVIVSFIVYVFLNFLDILITHINLSLGAVEINPLYANSGIGVIIAFKIIFLFPILLPLLVLLKLIPKIPREEIKLLSLLIPEFFLTWAIVFYLKVVYNNFMAVLQL